MRFDVALGAAALLTACAPKVEEPAGPAFSRVVVISVDTLRRDRLTRYAPDGRSLTPVLDEMMNEGFVLDDHHSCASWTYPSALCVATAQSTLDLGFVPQVAGADDVVLYGGGAPTISDWMREAGFATALVSANGFLCSAAGAGTFGLEQCGSGVASDVTAAALAFAAQQTASKRSFLHVHYLDPHQPYRAPPEFLEGQSELPSTPFDYQSTAGLVEIEVAWPDLTTEERAAVVANLDFAYDAEVQYVDQQIGVLLDGLRALDMLDDALVLFWADHGEQLTDHGQIGHARTLYVEETATAAFFWASRDVPAVAWSEPTTHADLVPTLLSLLGLDVPLNQITGQIIGTSAPDRIVIQSLASRDQLIAATRGDLHLIYNLNGEKALYRTSVDPTEQDNVYDPADPDVIAIWDVLAPMALRFADLTGATMVEPGP
jgi:arylsulfatase A-like enzyme